MEEHSKEIYLKGAKSILIDHLETTSGDSVLVICDEFTFDVAGYIFQIAKDYAIDIEIIPIGSSTQKSFTKMKDNGLPSEVRAKIDNVNRVVVLQKREPDVDYFRLLVLEYCCIDRKKRTASMPGVTLDSLPKCIVDIEDTIKRTKLVLDLLVRSNKALIKTRSKKYGFLNLSMNLGEFLPISSTGRIEPGNWGNVPSGEAFIVPDTGKAYGEICIDGSIPGYPIPFSSEVIVKFNAGKATEAKTDDEEVLKRLYSCLFNNDGDEVVKNCTVLSELGIGTNKSMTGFTGLSIFDEKIMGTAHLGLGSSKQFDGPTKCAVHNDFVAAQPDLYINDENTLIISNGTFFLDEDIVYPNWRDIKFKDLSNSLVTLGPKAFRIHDNKIFLSWTEPRSRTPMLTQVGDLETSYICSVLYEYFSRNVTSILNIFQVVDAFSGQFSPEMILPAIKLMIDFRLLKYKM